MLKLFTASSAVRLSTCKSYYNLRGQSLKGKGTAGKSRARTRSVRENARQTRFRASISFARVLVPFKGLLRRPKFSFFRATYLFFQMIIVCLNGVKLVAHLSSCLLKVVYLKKNALITFYGIISHVIFTCEDIMFSCKSSRYCIGGHIMKSALSFWTPGYLKPTTNGKQKNFQQTL